MLFDIVNCDQLFCNLQKKKKKNKTTNKIKQNNETLSSTSLYLKCKKYNEYIFFVRLTLHGKAAFSGGELMLHMNSSRNFVYTI